MSHSFKRFNTTGSGVFVYFVLFVFTTSEILQAVPLLNDLLNILRCLLFVVFLWNYFVGEKNIYVNLIILWQMAYIISSYINKNFTNSVLFYAINAITTTLFVMENIRINLYGFIRRARNWFFFLLVINLGHLLFGMPYASTSGSVYVLGLRVNFTLYCYAAVVFSLAYDYYVREIRGISRFSIAVFVAAVITLFIPMVATGLIGFLVIMLAYIVLKREKNYWILAVIAVVSTWGIIYQADFIKIFGSFLNLFGKDLTFSVRTYIWQRALSLIPLKPVWGYGISDMFVPAFGGVDHPAHNEILNVLYRGGAVSFAFIAVAFILVVKKSIGRGKWHRICMAFLFGIAIVMITEILSSQNAYQFILALFYFTNMEVAKEGMKNVETNL